MTQQEVYNILSHNKLVWLSVEKINNKLTQKNSLNSTRVNLRRLYKSGMIQRKIEKKKTIFGLKNYYKYKIKEAVVHGKTIQEKR